MSLSKMKTTKAYCEKIKGGLAKETDKEGKQLKKAGGLATEAASLGEGGRRSYGQPAGQILTDSKMDSVRKQRGG